MLYFKKQPFAFNYQGKEYKAFYNKSLYQKTVYSILFTDERLIKEFGEKHEVQVSKNGGFSSRHRMNVELVLSILMGIEPTKWSATHVTSTSPATHQLQ